MGKTLTKEKQPDPEPITPVLEPEDDADSISKLLTHPLFHHSQDPLLSIIIEPLRQILQPTQNNQSFGTEKKLFLRHLDQILPENRTRGQLATNEFEKINKTNKTFCWKIITVNEVCFRCLDCEVDKFSVQCKECFENADHKGHRVMKCKPESHEYKCDCGLCDTISLTGTCPNHRPNSQTIEEVLLDFPQEIRQKFTDTLAKAIYGILSIFEIQEKTRSMKLKAQISKFGQEYMMALLSFYSSCANQVSKAFSLVLERTLRSTFQAPYNFVWHDCNDLKDEYLARNSESELKECSCTVLGCIFRFAKYLPKNGQSKLKSILIESCKAKTSTRFLGRELSKYAYFLFGDPLNKDNEIRKHSSEVVQAVRNEFSLEEEDFVYVDYVLGALRRLLKGSDEMNDEKIKAVSHLVSPLANFITTGSKASEKVLYQTDFMAKLLEILADFQVTYLYPGKIRLGISKQNVDYNGLTMKLSIERLIYLDLDHCLKTLGDLPLDRRESEFKRIGKEWYSQFQKACMIQDHQRLYNKQINALSGLEKTLCLMILHYLQNNITKQSLEDFFRSTFPDVYPSVLASNVIKGPLITLGLMRFMDIIRTSTTSTADERGPYYTFMNIYECDIVLVQLMILLVKPQDLFSLFINSFFSYAQELRDLCIPLFNPQLFRDHSYSRRVIAALQDFLEFFIYVMNDEISLMNLNMREKVSRKRPDITPERVLENMLVNMLVGRKWFKVENTKAFAKIFIGENLPTSVNSIIAKIDPLITSKQEHESDLDPYMFYKLCYHQRTRQMKTLHRDMVSGKFYHDLPSFMTEIQQNIFQSQLPDFVCQIIINSSTNRISCLLQPALKLVLFNLQVVNQSLDNPNSYTENLYKKAQANFLTTGFSQSLSEILAGRGEEECKQCIDQIQHLIKQLSSGVVQRQQPTEQNLVDNSTEDPIVKIHKIQHSILRLFLLRKKRFSDDSREDPGVEETRQLRQVRMQMKKLKEEVESNEEKLEEELAFWQAAFAQKNEDLLYQDNVESPEQVIENSVDKKDLTCQFCLEKIDKISSEEYGVPIYFELTNNFYNTEEETVLKKESSTDLFKIDWWPVISSCHHPYHKKCFDKHCQIAVEKNKSSRFWNNVEVECALCKKLHSYFFALNTGLVPVTFKTQLCVLVIRHQLMFREDNLRSLERRNKQGDWFRLPLLEELKRAYEYFVESFHVSQKLHSLGENFELHLNFFKLFIRCYPLKKEEALEKKSFFKEIFEKIGQEKVYPDFVANNMLYNLFTQKFSLPEGKREFAADEHLQIIKEYLIFNIVSLTRSERQDNVARLSDILSLYKEDKEFKTTIIRELIFPMQKLLFAYYLNKCMFSSRKIPEKSEFFKILSSADDGNTAEKLDRLLKVTGVPLSFDQLVEEALSLIDTFSESEKNLLSSMLNPEIPPVLIRKLKLAPKFHAATFPKTYLEFSQIYVSKKCDLCGHYDPKFQQCVCLICGQVLCAIRCHKKKRRKMNNSGNLNKHANKHHLGLGLFFSIDHHIVYAIKSPAGISYSIGDLYVDELGGSISTILVEKEFSARLPKDVDFQKYVLDEKRLKKLERIIMKHSIGQEIFENAVKHPKSYAHGL